MPDLPETIWIDTHCHLYLEPFQHDLHEVIARAQSRGVGMLIVPGIDLETSQAAVALSEHYPTVFAAVGVHPNYATSWNSRTLAELRALCTHSKVVAIGEIGLDYYRNYAPPELQQAILTAQLNLAAERGLPVILHQRASFQDLQRIIGQWVESLHFSHASAKPSMGVFHAFEGDLDEMTWITRLGFCLGLAGSITYRTHERTQAIIQNMPLEMLVLETDSPYLTPIPYRGKRNEPSNLVLVAEKICALRDIPLKELACITSTNATRLFNLPQYWSLL
ncbi:TatD family hydrolase [uncultured Thermanaerothrix sp.]|uniref:TatD family hydrolase n=1 Tax=uncultured Thermanaerothrix sp. TaxID=1195149 RepID=UPI0026040F33|nr:TatD family hydrolase [uncultured Thermanaerothrix sp.]